MGNGKEDLLIMKTLAIAASLAVFASLSLAQDTSLTEVVDAFDAANVCCLHTYENVY